MVNKTCLIAVEHTIKAEREELIIVGLLDNLLTLIVIAEIVQIEQVGETIGVVIGTTHISLLLRYNFAQVFH